MLIGFDQNGKRAGWGAGPSPHADVAPPAQRRHLTFSDRCGESYKPVVSSFGRKQPVRGADGAVGRGLQRKRMLGCNGSDRGSVSWRYPTRKSADFCEVWVDERSCQNRSLRGEVSE